VSCQLAIAFPADDVGRQRWARAIELVRDAVAHVGIKEVAFWLDASHTHVADAIHERERKVWHAHWLFVLGALLEQRNDDVSTELRLSLAATIAEAFGCRAIDAEPLTPEEEASALRRELARFGDAGRAAIDRVRRRGGRR